MATTKTSRKSTKKSVKRVAKKAPAKARSAAKRVAKKAPAKARSTAKRVTKAAKPSTRKAPKATRVDAIALLKQDHREVEEMFSRFERAGAGAGRRKEQLRDSITEALSRHAAIEEQVFYPAVREEVRGAGSDVLEALEEHHLVKFTLRECEDMDASDERFTAKMTVLMEGVRHHVKEEERDLFPKVRKSMSRARLVELGDELKLAKRSAPTRPHPYAPDEPPANTLIGGATAVVDRARTTGKKAMRRVRAELPV